MALAHKCLHQMTERQWPRPHHVHFVKISTLFHLLVNTFCVFDRVALALKFCVSYFAWVVFLWAIVKDQSRQLSWWSRSPAGWAKLTPHASSWLYPSKSRYQSGIVKVMKAQQSGPLRSALLVWYWFSITSPICSSNPIVSGDWSKAEQNGSYM